MRNAERKKQNLYMPELPQLPPHTASQDDLDHLVDAVQYTVRREVIQIEEAVVHHSAGRPGQDITCPKVTFKVTNGEKGQRVLLPLTITSPPS